MSLTLQNPLKDPSAVLDYVFDWSEEWLATGETIALHPDTGQKLITITVPTGITLDSWSESDGEITVWLSGGTVGTTYRVECEITTSAGRKDERSMWIRVADR